jgi:uncharacterized protein YfaS (alpha-2-macroglobulin family)
MKRWALALALMLLPLYLHAAGPLTIVKAGPVGEVAEMTEANEIRVIFSEPMVVLGKIPNPVVAPFFSIKPAVSGSLRWSGTTTLIFTPDAKTPLPYATKFDVTVDATAKSVAGKTLGKDYSFAFTTPTVRMKRVIWYRKNKRAPDSPVLVLIYFNQPVDAATIVPHLQLREQTHEVELPPLPQSGLAMLKSSEPAAETAYDAKIAKTKAVAASNGKPVLAFVTKEWDQETYKPAPELIVLETKPGVAPDTSIGVYIDGNIARTAVNASSGQAQEYSVKLEPTFFVEKIGCEAECNPDYSNQITFRIADGVDYDALRAALTVTDVTDPARSRKLTPAVKKIEDWQQKSSTFGLDELGYSVEPAHTYLMRIDPSLQAYDGQKLGYTVLARIEYWHRGAFTSFGDGHGVWEATGGPVLPFHARNFKDVDQWVAPVAPEQLMPTILRLQPLAETEDNAFTMVPPGVQPQHRRLAPVADNTQSYGLDLKSALGRDGKGLVWAAVKHGEALPRTKSFDGDKPRATLVQVTNLGITIKDSPQNTLVLVTSLDDGSPVANANVAIRTLDNSVFWSGRTDAHGIAMAANTSLRITPKMAADLKAADEKAATETTSDESEGEESDAYLNSWDALNKLHFIVTAEKDGDFAYVASNWNNGVLPWEFSLDFELGESQPLLRGTVFSDRGVYKPGEDVHFKAVLRSDTPTGMQLMKGGTVVSTEIRDSRDKVVDRRKVKLNDWSSAEWIFKVPADGALGNYTVIASADGVRLRVNGEFLVAAYRRPDFRVDVTLTAASSLTGTPLAGRVKGRYLFGGAMSGKAVKWTYSRMPTYTVPAAIEDRFPSERYTFIGYDPDRALGSTVISSKETKLAKDGELPVKLDTDLDAGGIPYDYTLQGDVTDISRQHIANRASFRVNPAPWYIGIETPPYFANTPGFDTHIVAAALDGSPAAGVKVSFHLKRVQWVSTRQAEGNGFYSWDSERKEVEAAQWDVTTQGTPVTTNVPLKEGGEYLLVATATDAEGRTTRTRLEFYALGDGYTAWQRYDTNRIDLIPERQTYKPGDTARIMVKSPWEHATALVTTEREGVRTSKEFPLTSTQQTITVPITERDIPNVYVSVLLVKGRTKEPADADESDPGKPTFRLGYTELKVVDASKRLKVAVKADRAEFRPGTKARIDVDVHDVQGKASQSEVTLWAVDYGVLSLTGYTTPDVLGSMYLKKALQVATEDSREKIVSRRVLTPKGGPDGGGGGADAGPGTLRKDFRVLAFWLGSLPTDRNGHLRTDVTLPESLTTYRVMAVAADRDSRFGWAQNEIRVNKPLLLSPAFPRFLAVGDKSYFGAVVHSQLKQGGNATVTIHSLDPQILDFTESSQNVDLAAGGAVEARFHAVAKSIGTARIQMSVKLGGESDALQEIVPVRVVVSPETVAAYGEAKGDATETLVTPTGVVPGVGGLHVELASTALVGLGEGARYLVDYPYGCAEQRSSAAFALMTASDLGDAFKLPGIDAKAARTLAQTTLTELTKFQCGNGGYAFWAGQCNSVSPFVTSWVLHVMQRGEKLKYDLDKDGMQRAYKYLDGVLAEKRPANEGWWPMYTGWQSFAVKVLTEGGRNEDSNITRLYGYVDRMPLFGIAYLADAMIAKGERGTRLVELHRRITNAIAPEAGSAHVQELSDAYLPWLWSTNERTTAIVLATLVRHGGDDELMRPLVHWLLSVRTKGRWGSTQENAWAMEALIDYYRKYEAEPPSFTGTVAVGNTQIARDEFRGRSTEAKIHDIPIQQLVASAPAGRETAVTFHREGVGTLFYAMRLRYAQNLEKLDPLDHGFIVERKYAMQNGGKSDGVTFNAGDLITVTLLIRNTKERRFVAVDDPIPAGTEPVESWFATTASDLAKSQASSDSGSSDWTTWWRSGGFDHIERHDDRVNLFATRLGTGPHEYTYLLRATTAGTFVTAPMHAEEMYEPEIFGRSGSVVVEIKP